MIRQYGTMKAKPVVSIIIPARNEERNIGRCLDSLQRQQDAQAFEIIVVDDQSSDRTAEIARERQGRDRRIRLVRITELPAGWVGKNFALYQGFLAAKGEWLLFCDADTSLYPSSLAHALTFARSRGIDCLSYSPEQECGSFWERILQPAVFQLLNDWFSYDRVSDPMDDQAAANGQFILISRKAIETIGNHSAVKDEIVEDVEIARAVRNAGFRVSFAPGAGIVRTRMYRSFQEWWSGWTKSLCPLRKGRLRSIVAATAWRFLLDLAPPAALILLLILGGSPPAPLPQVVSLACGLLIVGRLAWTGRRWRRMGYQARYAVFYPLSSLVLIGVLWNSVYRHRLRGEVEWKGRHYSKPA
jgi:chlorobactene glucosyltransferase